MFEFSSLQTPAIIAFKGLPATHKSFTAAIVAKWAKSPVLCIEDFLAPDASPSMDKAQHLLRGAFDTLCRVAERQARDSHVNCVVIKSRLSTTFELDRLIDLMLRCDSHALLIIQCGFISEFQRQLCFNRDYVKEKHWYKLKSWNEVEMAGEEYNAQAWDIHFENSIATLPDHKRQNVKRLVLDSSSDLIYSGRSGLWRMGPIFSESIVHLISKDVTIELSNTTTLHDLRRALIERSLNTPRQKRNYICTGKNRCLFKYREAFEVNVYRCWVCEKLISGAGYECYFCNLVLHKSCAEEPPMVYQSKATPYLDRYDEMVSDNHFENPYYHFTRKHACNICKETRKPFSYKCRSCFVYTHLKCRLMPTIVNHDCHPEHFLSLVHQLSSKAVSNDPFFKCIGCGKYGYLNGYTCYLCGYGYHIRCLAAAREVKHKHGGYEHVMQLMYSFDGMEKQEEFWCDICQKDMDSTVWFYRCKECPYYISHINHPSRLPCKNTVRVHYS